MALQLFRDDDMFDFFGTPFLSRRELVPFREWEKGMVNTNDLKPILKMDLVESETGYSLHADMPGVLEGDVDVQVVDNNLVIKGHREKVFDEKTEKMHRMERSYGSVQRSIRLPKNADKTKVAAHLENGVLTVTLPKCEPTPEAVKVPITVKNGNH